MLRPPVTARSLLAGGACWTCSAASSRLRRSVLLMRFATAPMKSGAERTLTEKPRDRACSPALSRVVVALRERFLLASSFPDWLLKSAVVYDDDTLAKMVPQPSAKRRQELLAAEAKKEAVYAGFDPTADSLHVGNLLVLCTLLHFYAAGFRVVALIGGGTARVGDPSGRTNERAELADGAIDANSVAIAEQVDRIFGNFVEHCYKGSKTHLQPVNFVNNLKWLRELRALDFVGAVGSPLRKVRLGHMLQKDSVRTRLDRAGEGLSFAEFSYQLFQAYDWLELYERFGCLVQLGGGDQAGNVHSGHDLIKYATGRQDAFGLFVPIVTSETGKKVGKSEGAAVWLDGRKTTPYEIYQHFMHVTDLEVLKWMRLFTFYSVEQIDEICARHFRKPEDWWAQTKLAEQVTLLVHGASGLDEARRCTAALFGESAVSLASLDAKQVDSTFRGVPSVELVFRNGMTLIELLAETRLFGDEAAAMAAIRRGSIYVNHVRVDVPDAAMVRGVHVLQNEVTLLRSGKRNYFLVRWKAS